MFNDSSLIPSLDPLLAKVMAFSEDSREDALALMETTLAETVLNGPPTNVEFLEAIIKSAGMALVEVRLVMY